MDETEIVDLLEGLERVAEEAGLGALVVQEQSLAEVGGPAGDALGDPGMTPAAVPPHRGELALKTVGPRDRLAVLLDLVEAAAAGQWLVEEAVRQDARVMAGDGLVEDTAVEFAIPDSTGGSSYSPGEDDVLFSMHRSDTLDLPTVQRPVTTGSWTLGAPDSARLEAVRVLVGIVDELRVVADVTRGEWLTTSGDTDRQRLSWPA